MPSTKGRYEQGTPVADGVLVVDPEDILISGTATRTRNGASDWSINVGATQAVIFGINFGKALQRAGLLGRDIQQQFGGSGIVGDAEQAGRYGTDYTGNPETVRTAITKKGIKLTGIKVISLITGAALTVHTCRVDKNVYANNVAIAQTAVLATGANGLPTATQANPYVTAVAVPGSDFVQDLEEYFIEVAATTQGGGAYRLYRVELQITYNVN